MIAASLLLWLGLLVPANSPANTPPAPAARPARVSAQGTLRSAGERHPIAHARIFATSRRGPAWTRDTTTAADGSFILADLPSLDFILTIVAAGHERLEQPTTAPFWRRRKPPTIYLQPTGSGRYRTIVSQERTPKPSPFNVQLSPDEIAALPGSQGDPLRALQNLPGSARVPAGLGLIVLRGASPNQSQVFVGEHPVPRAFHIPGLASIVPAGILSGLQYVPSNFSSHYGNATGGIVVLTPRVGRRDGLHGYGKLDIISAGALVEGPVGRGSFLIAAQRGYLDLAIGALGPEVLGSNVMRPKYGDYQVVFDHPVGPGATMTARILGASDVLRYESGGVGETLTMSSAFHRFDLVYKQRRRAWDLMLAPAMRLDRSGVEGQWHLRRRADVVGLLRAEATTRPSRRFLLTIGLDTAIDRHRTRTLVEPRPGSIGVDPFDDLTRGLWTTSGAYLSPLLTFGRFSLSPGLRVSMFTGPGEPKFSVDPRIQARWAPHSRVAIQLGAGRYSQPHFARFGAPVGGYVGSGSPLDSLNLAHEIVLPGAVRYLNPQLELDPDSRLGLRQALQLSANIHLDITAALGFDGTVFYRRDRVSHPVDADPLTYFPLADGGGATYGLEAMLRHDLTSRLFGWIAYTWMNSRTGYFAPEGRLYLQNPADFDQRHNLVAVLGLKLPRRWQIGGRFRLVTGLPFTPIVGSLKQDGPNFYTNPLTGELNSARMPIFHQLDIRIDKTWVMSRTIVAAYLDVQNIYNRQNPEGLWYLHDYSGTQTVVGIPILPVLGLRLDF